MEIIKHCPSCNTLLVRVKDQLFCKNTLCGTQQTKRVVGFANKVKIKGLGEKTIEKLGITNIPEIYSITLEEATASIGDKLAVKLVHEIEKAKSLDIATFLSACSIPLIGTTAAKKVGSVAHHPKDINMDVCKDAGLGDKASSNLTSWIESEYMNNLITLPVIYVKLDTDVNNTEYETTICITGRVSGYTKSTLTEKLKKHGIKVVGSVTKSIDYLLCEDQKGSSKEAKATSYGINIVTLNQLLEKI